MDPNAILSFSSCGVCWNTSPNPTIEDFLTDDGSGPGHFNSELSGLSHSTTYYVKGYATDQYSTTYGDEMIFNTDSSPTIYTTSATEITATTATSGGYDLDNGGNTITAKGICWSIEHDPTLSDTFTEDGAGSNDFTSYLTGLDHSTLYFVRAYATNNVGTTYAAEIWFTTDQLPTLSTSDASVVTTNTATSGGYDLDNGGDPITAKGVCWGTMVYPTINDDHTVDGTGTDDYTSYITGLNHSTTYHVRAYATNGGGTSYGNVDGFVTDTPTLSTSSITNVETNSANSGGYNLIDGNDAVTSKGVCWSTSPDPTIADYTTDEGGGNEDFTSSLSGLTHSTTYYLKAYMINSSATYYGSQRSFTTVSPSISTSNITDVYSTTATSGGYDIIDGNDVISAKGVCWNTSSNPTTANSKTDEGSGTDDFVSYITGLSPGITYYVRAYITYSNGTRYGEQKSFITNDVPSVSTNSTINIDLTSAVGRGNVTSDNGDAVTECGVCWSTSPNPNLSDSYAVGGSGEGEFQANITGLQPDTRYYVRAYATNSLGTTFGEDQDFFTPTEILSDLEFDGNNDNVTTSITLPNQGTVELWINFDGFYQQGTLWHAHSDYYNWHCFYDNGAIKVRLGFTPFRDQFLEYGNLDPNTWHHIAVTWLKVPGYPDNFIQAALYVNGNLVDSNETLVWENPEAQMTIGARSTGSNYLNSEFEEFRIWNTIRTLTEIRENMFYFIDPEATGLICYYDFDYVSGNTISDRTGNGYTGTMHNFGDDPWNKSSAPVGVIGEGVRTTAPVSLGDTGKTISVDISSGGDSIYIKLALDYIDFGDLLGK